MEITAQYLLLIEQKRFSEALPLIEELVCRNPNIATSQFNYGICLVELHRYPNAARAFLHAYKLKPEMGGALYRGCLALADADDSSGLLNVFQRECLRDPKIIALFFEEVKFTRFWEMPEFKSLKNKYAAS